MKVENAIYSKALVKNSGTAAELLMFYVSVSLEVIIHQIYHAFATCHPHSHPH